MGGTAGCRKLSVAFYTRVERDTVLRPLFPRKTMTCAIEEFAAFLAQFLGGPAEDAQRRWWLSLRESHLRFKIGQKERDAWMKNMVKALDEAQIEEPARSALREFFHRSSAYVVNSGPAPSVAEDRNDSPERREIAYRWDVQRQLDEAVAAIRSADAGRAIPLAEACDRNILAGLLALMIGAGQSALLDYVQEKLTQDPALVQERYAGRTLLHTASGAGSLSIVELLLRLGADPNAPDGGGHTPLYSVGNECKVSDGGKVVHALVRAGAKVDAHDGVKHCTALHMAARRGNVVVAKALLECGADIEARDTLGETPLRRSVNCDKSEVASVLLSMGADRHSRGSKGLTPLLAARSNVMKRLLHSSPSLRPPDAEEYG
jgi:truncated hemoglobin YjbI